MTKDLRPTRFNQEQSAYKSKMDEIKSRGKPRGGVPPVRIPLLNAEPIPGPDGNAISMSQQAEILNNPKNPLSPKYDPSLVDTVEEEDTVDSMDPHELRRVRNEGADMNQGSRKGPFGGTISPQEAANDPNFRQGVGAMYADNQPAMKAQGGGGKGLSDKTVEGLDALNQFNQKALEEQERAAEEELKKSSDVSPEERAADDMGLEQDFLDEFRERRVELDTKELREAIESRCKEMSIDQLIEDGELRQEVPIVRKKFTAVFRTISGEEDLALKREVYTDSSAPEVYLFDKLMLMQLAAGIYSINGKPLPTHLNERRRFDKKLFQIKFKKVFRMALPMIASLSVNFRWFDVRARKLFIDLDELKNG